MLIHDYFHYQSRCIKEASSFTKEEEEFLLAERNAANKDSLTTWGTKLTTQNKITANLELTCNMAAKKLEKCLLLRNVDLPYFPKGTIVTCLH